METIQPPQCLRTNRGWILICSALFVTVLVLNGTFFRIRVETEVPELDWLVVARLVACALGFFFGVLLLLRTRGRFGLGFWALTVFLASTALSAFTSDYPTVVIGYFVLLLGASTLVMALVRSATTVQDLELFEKVWFWTISFCVIKDAITSLFFPDPEALGGVVRLGMGITHANPLSLLAGLAFWLSFTQRRAGKVIWLLRIAFIFIIIGAVSRISLLAFLAAGFVFFFFSAQETSRRLTILFASVSAAILLSLIVSLQQPVGKNLLLYAKRGQTEAEVLQFTARTYIWEQVIEQVPESPLTGHGYGISRLELKPIWSEFEASHCHNEFLEALFSMGIVGLFPLLIIYAYNMKWLFFFSKLRRVFSHDVTVHAVCVVVMMLISTMFEARISVKLFPFQPLFFFYLLVLDRQEHISLNEESYP